MIWLLVSIGCLDGGKLKNVTDWSDSHLQGKVGRALREELLRPVGRGQRELIVGDRATGKTVPELTWSWKTMDLPNGVEEYSEVEPGVELVAFRPVISDLRAAIKERRPVKLASVALSSADIEAACRRHGDWVE